MQSIDKLYSTSRPTVNPKGGGGGVGQGGGGEGDNFWNKCRNYDTENERLLNCLDLFVFSFFYCNLNSLLVSCTTKPPFYNNQLTASFSAHIGLLYDWHAQL